MTPTKEELRKEAEKRKASPNKAEQALFAELDKYGKGFYQKFVPIRDEIVVAIVPELMLAIEIEYGFMTKDVAIRYNYYRSLGFRVLPICMNTEAGKVINHIERYSPVPDYKAKLREAKKQSEIHRQLQYEHERNKLGGNDNYNYKQYKDVRFKK